MSFFFNLPIELQTYIYEFDPTYNIKFKSVLNDISFLNAHRYFFYKNKYLCCFYITPKNLLFFLNEYCSFFTLEKKIFIKEYLENCYNNEQINILGDDIYEIYFDIEEQYTFKKPITKIDTSWKSLYDILNN